MLNSALNEEGQTAVGSLQAIITVLRENGSADLRSLGAVACENESVDWAEVFSQLDDKANCMQTAYEATILSLAQVALCFACFGGQSAVGREIAGNFLSFRQKVENILSKK